MVRLLAVFFFSSNLRIALDLVVKFTAISINVVRFSVRKSHSW